MFLCYTQPKLPAALKKLPGVREGSHTMSLKQGEFQYIKGEEGSWLLLIANCLLLKDFQNRHSVDQRKNVSADKTLPNTHPDTQCVCTHTHRGERRQLQVE